jgi:serine protease Do
MKISIILSAFVAVALLPSQASSISGLRETPIVRVVRQCGPAVVNIRTETVVNLRDIPEWGAYGRELDQFFKQYFGDAYSKGTLRHKSIGSGVVLDNRGLIVTNAHVVEKAHSIFIVMNDGKIVEGKVLKKNREDDLAIVKVNLPHRVETLKLADFNDVKIGETAIAIGDPLGLENSVTVGVISGKNRDFSSEECTYACTGLIQTDASINPGNSGGALLNLDGELIGINLAVVQNAQNIGFAVPSFKVERLMRSLR